MEKSTNNVYCIPRYKTVGKVRFPHRPPIDVYILIPLQHVHSLTTLSCFIPAVRNYTLLLRIQPYHCIRAFYVAKL